MASPTTVDVPGMHSGAATIMDKSSELKSSESSVQSMIEGLMGTWQGASATGFNSAMNQFYDECNTIINTLQQLSQAVTKSANLYEQTHESNTTLATQFGSSVQPGLSGF